ncbi:GLABROUS1 enhancer-binding protein family [Sesbania bispinosa]|nr:GLABROUS1 enhancer-binding protein family [Sesbania bispinosa]
MDQTPKPNKAQNSSAPARSATKRSAENNAHVTDPKRAKKKPADSAAAGGSDDEVEEDEKKPGEDNRKQFQRLWSEEDEIAILKGIAEFTSKTGSDPLKYADAFYDFMKKSLHADASSIQLKDKIRRLKKKFETNAKKGKNGEDPTFSKPHEKKTFELSKKVWSSAANEAAAEKAEKVKSNGRTAKTPKKEGGSSRNAASAKKPKVEARAEPEQQQPVGLKESGKMHIDGKPEKSVLLSELVRFGNGVSTCGLNEDVIKKGVELMEESKRVELEGKWKKLQVAELELFVKRTQLIEDQTRLILEAFKSSDH